MYGREGPNVPLETITWQLEVSSARPEIRLDGGKSGAEAAGFAAVPVYDRYLLEPGATLEGPAVVEERESTVVIGPGSQAEVDGARNLVVGWPG